MTPEMKSQSAGPSRAEADTTWRRRGTGPPPPLPPQASIGGGAKSMDPRLPGNRLAAAPPSRLPANRSAAPPPRGGGEYAKRHVAGGSFSDRRPAVTPPQQPAQEELSASAEDNKIPVRTMDLYWQSYPQERILVRKNRREAPTRETKSRMPVVLRNLAPETTFDPRDMWAAEKKRMEDAKEAAAIAEAEARKAAQATKKGGKKGVKKPSKREEMIEKNKKDQEAKEVKQDLEKLENAVKESRLKAQLGATIAGKKCETNLGKLRQLLMILDAELKEKNMPAAYDALWAIEASPLYLQALEQEDDIDENKKEMKKKAAAASSSGKGGKSSKDDKKPTVVRTPEGSLVHEFRKELRSARQQRSDLGADLAAFQLESMYDRLPPLSPFLKGWKLDAWQKRVLLHVDQRKSVIVCAPTSSGKTVISTYTCVNNGRVLFVVPTEPLVWQVAAMFQRLLPGSNVALATNQLAYRPSEDKSKVVVGTPLALESALVKIRGVIGAEALNRWDYAQLDGGFDDFDYAVFDEVHALDGEEGAALQRLMRSVTCPMLALSATIGNANELGQWLQSVRDDAVAIVDGTEKDRVEVVEHKGRFINVQNLILDKKGKLERLHPCSALTTKRLVEEGPERVSFALTPADASALHKALAKEYGSEVRDLDPVDWFELRAKAEEEKYVASLKARVARKVPGAEAALKRALADGAASKAAASTRARITLDDSKMFESSLKSRLFDLVEADADRCDKVLSSFVPSHLVDEDDTATPTFSMLDVARQMAEMSLFPALAFHLDSFRCLGLFKSLVAELEAAEQAKYPNWSEELRAKADATAKKVEQQNKAQERNAKAAEEEAKDGFDDGETYVDVSAPHPEFVLAPPNARLSSKEIDDILQEVSKDTANKETLAPSHVLVRALRRGFAIYIDDAAFSVYRRIVQRLAQKGKLAVVFSDASLAYGVNMPFRTVAFCGDDGLNALLAQQMAGRAGRRGLDTQGNLVYLGMNWSQIRRLMVGTVPAISGVAPHFATIAVPYALSAEVVSNPQNALSKHVDRAMLRRLCASSLEEHIAGTRRSAKDSDDKVDECLKILEVLGLNGEGGAEMATDTRPTLCMIWELRNYLPESIALALALPHLLDEFVKDRHNFKRASDDADKENVQIEFMSVFLHIVGRRACKQGATPLEEISWLKKSPERVVNWEEWEKIIVAGQEKLDQLREGASCKLEVAPGTPLDSAVFDTFKDRRLPPANQITSLDRHNLKLLIWNVGNILLKMHNCLQLPGEYITLSPLLRKCFRRIMYILSDDINANVDGEDITQIIAKREADASEEDDAPATEADVAPST